MLRFLFATLILVACSDQESINPVAVSKTEVCPEDEGYDIDIVFMDDFLTDRQKGLVRRAADRWEQIIVGDVPAQSFTGQVKLNNRFTLEGTIDDIRIFVSVRELDHINGNIGAVAYNLAGGWPPYAGYIDLDPDGINDFQRSTIGEDILYKVILHEMGHCVGIYASKLRNFAIEYENFGWFFAGEKATAVFARIVGFDIPGVPLYSSNVRASNMSHWRDEVVGDELMIAGWFRPNRAPLSVITIAALEDLGYSVDYRMADDYYLPGSTSAAKSVPGFICGVE